MEEKERYYSLIDNNGNFELRDYKSNKDIHSLYELDDLLNQQDKRIKELELLLNAYKKMKTNSVKGFEKLKQENQQLKQQLKDKEHSHDLCIQHFEEETDKLRKQIKTESDARERFVEKVKQLKQTQKEHIINILEYIMSLCRNGISVYYSLKYVCTIIENQIKKNKGEE